MTASGIEPEARGPVDGPDKATGIFKIVLGLAFAAATVYLVTLHAGQSQNAPSAVGGAISGIAAGLALAFFLGGIAAVRGKRIGRPAGIGLVVICAVVGGFVEPRVLQGRRVQMEQAAWERLQASPKDFRSYQVYERSAPAPRRGYRPGMALAQVRQEVELPLEKSIGRVATLRRFISDYRGKAGEEEPGAMQPAIDLAHAELARAYARGLEGLAGRAGSGKAAEFERDAQMMSAFRTVLERLAAAEDDHVYLAFTSDNNLAPVTTQPAGPDDARALDHGEAFAPEREDARRRAFIKALEDAIEQGFAEPLVRLRTLGDGQPREGKVILDVRCATRRAPGGFDLTINDKPIGRLFNLDVAWKFQVFDVDGKLLAAYQSRSNPAEKLQFTLKKADPSWAAYSVMMDSAYYNFCRQISGRLGLAPPAVRGSFSFER